MLVSAMHITAGVWINDDEPGIQADALEWLDKLAPPSWQEPDGEVARELLPDPGDYRHHRGGEDNGDAHLKNLLVHHQVIVPGHRRAARPGAMAADLLLRVRRRQAEAARDQGDGGVADGGIARVRRRTRWPAGSRSSPAGERISARRRRPSSRAAAPTSSSPAAARTCSRQAATEIGDRCTWVAGDIREPGEAPADRRGGARPPRPPRPPSQQRRRPVLRARRGDHREGLACGPAAQRRAGRSRCARRRYELAMGPARGGTIVNVTVSPHHGMPAMAHTGAARAAVEALTRELAARWAPDGVSVLARSRSADSRPSRCASTPASCGARRRRPSPSSASARWRSTAGWSPCSRRRSDRRSRARWSRSTARSTTGPGRGRPPASRGTARSRPRTRRGRR